MSQEQKYIDAFSNRKNISKLSRISTKIPDCLSISNSKSKSFYLFSMQGEVSSSGITHKVGFLLYEPLPKDFLNDGVFLIKKVDLTDRVHSDLIDWHLKVYNILLSSRYQAVPNKFKNWFQTDKFFILCPVTQLLDIDYSILEGKDHEWNISECSDQSIFVRAGASHATNQYFRFNSFDSDSNSIVLSRIRTSPKLKYEEEDLVAFDLNSDNVKILKLFNIPYDYFLSIQIACFKIWRMERKLVCYEFVISFMRLNPQFKIDWVLLDTALTADFTLEGDRLSPVGHSICSLLVTDYVFNSSNTTNPSDMSKHRAFIFSSMRNSFIFESWIKYIMHIPYEKFRFYDPPGFEPCENKKDDLSLINLIKIMHKIVATFFYCGDKVSMMKFVLNCGFKIRDMEIPAPFIEPKVLMDDTVLGRVENILGYTFKNKIYISNALTHASYLTSTTVICDQLEFLGDSVLEVAVISKIFSQFERFHGGEIVYGKSSVVNNKFLASVVVTHRLYEFFRCSDSRKEKILRYVREGSEDPAHYKPLSDIFESIIGAIYLDSNRSTHEVLQTILRLVTITSDYSRSSVRVKARPAKLVY